MLHQLDIYLILEFLKSWISIRDLSILDSALCNTYQRDVILTLQNVKMINLPGKMLRGHGHKAFCGCIKLHTYMKESIEANLIIGKKNTSMHAINCLIEHYCESSCLKVIYVSSDDSISELISPANCWKVFTLPRVTEAARNYWFSCEKGHFSISSISSNQGNNSFVVQIRTSAAVFTRELPGEGSEEDVLKAFIYRKNKGVKWTGTKCFSAVYPQNRQCFKKHDLDYMYVGDICDGEEHGQGTRTAANGTVYVGEWRNGFMEGYGTMVDAEDGTRYTGEWLNHCRQGLGEMVYCDGSKYVGEWNRDQPRHNPNNCLAGSGGTMTYADGSQYSGGWEWGFRNGDGQMIYADGSKYVGMWNYDRRWGEEMIEVDGSKYKCCGWLADKHSGHYEMSYSDDGSEYNTGVWCRNQCVCKCKK